MSKYYEPLREIILKTVSEGDIFTWFTKFIINRDQLDKFYSEYPESLLYFSYGDFLRSMH